MKISLLNDLVRWQARKQFRAVKEQLAAPDRLQQDVIHQLTTQAQHTEYGRINRIPITRQRHELTQAVPVNNYESLKPFIYRMMRGEANILVPGKVTWYAKSSGTTSDRSKFIPTPEWFMYRNHIRCGWLMAGCIFDRLPGLDVFSGKLLHMAGSYKPFDDYPVTKTGDVSSLIIEHMPWPTRWTSAIDKSTALMSNTDAKIEKIAQKIIHTDLRVISGAPTWMTVLFRYVRDLSGKDRLLDVWPNLRLIVHGGMSFTPYRQQFTELFPDPQVRFFDVYNASEGYFSFQDPDEPDEHLVMLGQDIYYELLPASEWDSPDPQTIDITEAEVGTLYAPVISTTGGLWRYITGDSVRITSINPLRWQIVGRMREHINVFGEEVMVSDTDKALHEVCAKLNTSVYQYTVGPVFFSGLHGRGGHEWVIEFEQPPADIEQFTHLLDLTMQQINSDYEAKRYNNLALTRIKMNVAPKGTFNRWLKAKGKYGLQNKVPRLANHRGYIDEILKFSF